MLTSDHPLLEWLQFFNPKQIGLSEILTLEDSAYDTRDTQLTVAFTAADALYAEAVNLNAKKMQDQISAGEKQAEKGG